MSKKKQSKQISAPVKAVGNDTTTGLNSMMHWLMALVIILPVLFSTTTQDPAICIRYIFLGGFLLFFGLYFFIYRKAVTVLPAPRLVMFVFGLGLAYVGWALVTMFTAVNYREGIYETSRHLLHLFLLFVVMVTVVKEGGMLLKLFKALVVVAIFHSLVGILQYYDIGFAHLPGDNDKPFGLMANRNLFASALMLLFPFVLYMLYEGNRAWKITGGIATGLLVWALLLSQTRADWVAVTVIFIVSQLLVLAFSKANRRLWLTGSAGVVAASALIISIVLMSDSGGKLRQSVAERVKSFTRGGVTNDANKYNAEGRLLYWQKTVALIKDKPVTGCGNSNWKIAIPAYGSEGMVEAYGKFAPDRTHNVYLQLAAENGVPGAFLYIGMWLLIAIIAIKVIRSPKNEEQRILIILLLSGLAGLAADAFFSFPTERMEHSVFMYLAAGIIVGSYAGNKQAGEKLPLKASLFVACILICIANLYIGFVKKNFEAQWVLASMYEKQGRYAEMLEEAEKGKSSLITLEPGGLPLELKTAAALQEMRQNDRALIEIDKAVKYNPNAAVLWNYRGTIHARLGQLDASLADFLLAKKLAPHFDKVLKNLGMNYFLLKQYKECVAILEQADISGDPQLQSAKNEARRQLANPQ